MVLSHYTMSYVIFQRVLSPKNADSAVLIRIRASFTEKYLAHLGFVWHRIDEESFAYLKEIGYIEN